jgi:PQQ-like domain
LSLPDFTDLWQSKDWRGWLQAPPAVAEGIGYASLGFEGNHTHSGLCAFEVASGREIFQVGDDNEVCPLPPVMDDEDIEDMIDDEDGQEDLPGDWLLFGTVHTVTAEGLVWMPLRREHEDDGLHQWDPWENGEIVGLDPHTGERRWHFALDLRERSEITGAVAVANGVVYFTAAHLGRPDEEDAASSHVLHAVDIATKRPRWMTVLSGMAVGAPELASGRVFVATKAGRVHAFEADTGQPAWTVETGYEIVNKYDLAEDFGAYYEEDGQAVLLGDDMIYVRTRAGIVALT